MITKAIILAAGFGTRFLPATKIVPKEMLPLIDKPIIQYSVEEAVASGIKEIILVIRPGVSAIRNHFGSKISLEKHLLEQDKVNLLEDLKNLAKIAKFSFVEQDPRLPYGTGAALVSAAKKIKKNEFFVFMFGDDLVKAKIPATKSPVKMLIHIVCDSLASDSFWTAMFKTMGIKTARINQRPSLSFIVRPLSNGRSCLRRQLSPIREGLAEGALRVREPKNLQAPMPLRPRSLFAPAPLG